MLIVPSTKVENMMHSPNAKRDAGAGTRLAGSARVSADCHTFGGWHRTKPQPGYPFGYPVMLLHKGIISSYSTRNTWVQVVKIHRC